jgi:drug/metabolite transporter (DMT)-like permease
MMVLGVIQVISVAIVMLTIGVERFTLGQTLLAVLAGLTYSSMCVCYVYAVRQEEISKVIPLFGFAPIFVALLAALMLGEIFPPLTYVGIALILAGAVTLSVQRVEGFRFNAAFWFMITAAASVAVTEVASKYLLGFHDYWSVFAYTRGISALSLIAVAWPVRHELYGMLRRRRTKVVGLMCSAELLNMLAILSVLVASSKGYVTLVNSITQVQPFIVLLFAVLLSRLAPQILQEEGGMRVFVRKLGSITVMFIGVLLVLGLQS